MTTPVLLDPEALRARLVREGPYAALDVLPVTGSTNTDLVRAAHDGAADRTVLLAEEQSSGRGRRDRSWNSPRGLGLHVSVLLRPDLSPSELARLPLVAGVAVVEAISAEHALRVQLKWPNDVLLGEATGDSAQAETVQWRKTAGILAEASAGKMGAAAVLGIGVNVLHDSTDLPRRADGLPATSLAAEGASVDRERFAIALLTRFAELEDAWRTAGGDLERSGLLERYRRCCATLGRRVRVDLSDGAQRFGTAEDVDATGALLLRADDGWYGAISAGDVVHLRAA